MRPVIYFILMLALIIFATRFLLGMEGCSTNKATDIYSNVKDSATDAAGDVADAASDLLEDSDGETAPPDEFNDAAATSNDVDSEDDDVIPLSGDDEEEDDEGYASSDSDADSDEDYSDSKEVIGGAYTEGSGDYMVIAGAFSVKNNADGVLRKIRDLGYPQAEVVKFDYSDYYSVCVARYETNRDAKKIANSLKSRYDVKAYVHKRRSKRG